MTKRELEQLLNLRKEIQELDARVEKLQKERAGKAVDKVHTSMKEYPYIYVSETIIGTDETDKKRRREMTENEILLLRRRQQAVDAEYRISQYIKGIKDSRIRRIISLRYEDGLSWERVADAMNCDRTYPEKLLSKYLNEQKRGKKRRK